MTGQTLLLVTGAGASRELGVDGAPLPLMKDWAKLVRAKLDLAAPNAAFALGLAGIGETSDAGIEFETRLGEFLEWRKSLGPARRQLRLGAPTILDENPQDIGGWFDNSERHAEAITQAIHESLCEAFSQTRIGTTAACQAYERLLNGLYAADRPLVYATTNYDVAAELAFGELGRRPNIGRDGGSPGTMHRLDVASLVTQRRTNETPVLHLHGCVGWYRDDNGDVVAHEAGRPFNPHAGVPALLLPDPHKSYADDSFLEAIWTEFEAAIEDAEHILVLGHSLHDQELLDRLGPRAGKGLAVSIRHPEAFSRDDANDDLKRLRELLPDAHAIPLKFGPELQLDPVAADAWLRNEAPAYPSHSG